MKRVAPFLRHAGPNNSNRFPAPIIVPQKRGSGNIHPPFLDPPKIVFANHHLLVVNKPAGWHSVPVPLRDRHHPSFRVTNDDDDDAGTGGVVVGATPRLSPKCLLTEIKSRRWGGGSQSDFVKSLHRIDQPCTGALVFAKNGKAASRIARAWKLGQVWKEYVCVVESDNVWEIEKRSIDWETFSSALPSRKGGFFDLLPGRDKGRERDYSRSSSLGDNVFVISGVIQTRGRASVAVVSPMGRFDKDGHESHFYAPAEEQGLDLNGGRLCHIQWRHLGAIPIPHIHAECTHRRDRKSGEHETTRSGGGSYQLIAVRTNSGVRHQVRALLSAVGGCAVAGDVRYGAVHGPLPDRSVALHARRLFMPTVSLGGMDFLRSAEPFVALIPDAWSRFFGLTEDLLLELERGAGLF